MAGSSSLRRSSLFCLCFLRSSRTKAKFISLLSWSPALGNQQAQQPTRSLCVSLRKARPSSESSWSATWRKFGCRTPSTGLWIGHQPSAPYSRFNTALEDVQGYLDPNVQALVTLTVDHIAQAMDNVATAVFPHRALEIQKLWMNRGMRKPYDLSTCKTAAAITKINNSLPLFLLGNQESKLTDQELLQKFDVIQNCFFNSK
jgi:hypothetical protein